MRQCRYNSITKLIEQVVVSNTAYTSIKTSCSAKKTLKVDIPLKKKGA